MSGHSHWSSIKHKKSAVDAKRGKLFSKLSRLISMAAKEKGPDPETNPKLKLSIEKAKQMNMPKDNIDRAIKRGTGELSGEQIIEVIYEAFGPGGTALVIEVVTDNKNRALNEIKNVLKKHQAHLGTTHSTLRLFKRQGI